MSAMTFHCDKDTRSLILVKVMLCCSKKFDCSFVNSSLPLGLLLGENVIRLCKTELPIVKRSSGTKKKVTPRLIDSLMPVA